MSNKNTLLLLGNKGSGKKTFVTHALPGYQQSFHESFALWENANTRIVTPNSELNEKNAASFIRKLKKYNFSQPIQLLIFFIDLPSLIDSVKRETIEHFIDAHLSVLKKFQPSIASLIIVTHCDHLLGFQEYFGSLTAEERKEPFSIKNRLEVEFLLKNITRSMITRLHQEPLQEKRNLLQLFPAQFEKITEYISPLLTRVDRLYFISQKQALTVIDVLTKNQVPAYPMISEKKFFVDNLMVTLSCLAEKSRKTAHDTDKKRWVVAIVCATSLAALLIFWHKGFKQTTAVIIQTQSELQQHPTESNVALLDLSQLNLLSDSIQRLNTPSLNSIALVGLNQSAVLKKKLMLLYDAQLQIQFLPYIENQLTDTLRNTMGSDPMALYNALKIYLMLTYHSHYDANTVLNWFTTRWSNQYPNNQLLQHQLLNHLKNTLSLSNTSWPQNKMLIADAQKILQQLPMPEAAFLKLQDSYNNARVPLSSLFDGTTNFDITNIFIPDLYSTSHFKMIYNQQIPAIVNTLSEGDWVTGIVAYKKMTAHEQTKMLATVRALYLHYFSQAWQDLIPTITLKTPDNLADLQALIQDISNPESSFMNLLAFVSGNALLSNTVTPSYSLAQLDAYLHKKQVFTQTQMALKNLSTAIKPIGTSDDVNKASYNAALTIINNPTAPNAIEAILALDLGKDSTLKVWLDSLAIDAWRIILINSTHYLNAMWVKLVMPDYNNNINNRYPIFKDGIDDITLADFMHFFEPSGTIDVFFNYYLKPFVNMSTSYWTWSRVYGEALPLSQSTLESLMRASLIQRMFFTDDPQKALFKFQLIPVSKSDSIDSIEIDSEGQTLSFSSTQNDANMFVWPGPRPEEASIRIMYTAQAPYLKTFTGTWALFRLMQFATLIPTTNPQQYIMQINLGTATITYHIISDNNANAFLPGVIDQFRLTEQL